MKKINKDKLRKWFEDLEHSKQVDIALECIEELIYTESVKFYDDDKAPYWDTTGDRLDGTEYEDKE